MRRAHHPTTRPDPGDHRRRASTAGTDSNHARSGRVNDTDTPDSTPKLHPCNSLTCRFVFCGAVPLMFFSLVSNAHKAAHKHADVAQLVAHHLAKVRVAGSNPVIRSVALPVAWPSGEATACKAVHTGSIPVATSTEVPQLKTCAISSVGERFPDTEEVTSSILVSRTMNANEARISPGLVCVASSLCDSTLCDSTSTVLDLRAPTPLAPARPSASAGSATFTFAQPTGGRRDRHHRTSQ